MPLQLKFNVSPDPMRFFDGIQSIKAQLRDFREPFRQLVPIFGSELARSLREGGKPIGAPAWAPHSKASVQRFGAKQHALLINRGRLLRELYKSGKQKLTKSVLRYGPKRQGYFVQQFGSKKRGIPARQYVGMTEPMSNAALALMEMHHARIIAQASARIGRPVRV